MPEGIVKIFFLEEKSKVGCIPYPHTLVKYKITVFSVETLIAVRGFQITDGAAREKDIQRPKEKDAKDKKQ
jgi:hypothetical protein